MRVTWILGLISFVVVTAAPRDAVAQAYPDRVRVASRHASEAYQGRDRDREEQTERTTRTVKLGANGSLDVGNIAGDIVVTRGGGSDATIEIVKTARGSSVDDAKQMLSLVSVDVDERAGRVEIRTNYPRGDEGARQHRRNVNVSVSYTISAPAGTALRAHSISGDIKITGITGEVAADSVSGEVEIGSAAHVTTARSVSGNVTVADSKVDGTLEASSVSGDVILRKVTSSRLDVGSVSGDVRLLDVGADRVDAQSVSGDLEFSGALAPNGRYALKSHSGEVRLTLAGTTGFEVEATSFSGDVRSDIPLKLRSGDDQRHRRRSLNGTFGDGSAVLDLSTFSGSIVIAKQ